MSIPMTGFSVAEQTMLLIINDIGELFPLKSSKIDFCPKAYGKSSFKQYSSDVTDPLCAKTAIKTI